MHENKSFIPIHVTYTVISVDNWFLHGSEMCLEWDSVSSGSGECGGKTTKIHFFYILHYKYTVSLVLKI